MNKIFWIIIILVVMTTTFFLIDSLTGTEYHAFNSKVIHRSYTPASSSSNVGTDFDGNMVVTYDYDPEVWSLIIEASGKNVFKVSENFWMNHPENSLVGVYKTEGGITGWHLGTRLGHPE